MRAMSKTMSLVAVAVALSCGHVFAKGGGGGGGAGHPTQVKTSGASATPSGPSGGLAKHACGHGTPCPTRSRPGYTQPPCKGPHMGPNGVMIQCD
jgi:hypothetical protein